MLDKIKSNSALAATIGGVSAIILIVLAVVLVNTINNGGKAIINYSDESRSAVIELGADDETNPDSDFYDMGEAGETIIVDDLPTVEEIDGGQFEDADTGVSLLEGEYEDLGAAVETFDTSSPQAFRNATLGKCIIANNRYGAQCVSLARSFWWSYAGRDVSTCGTGAAKGMMNCAEQNAGNDFEIHWKADVNQIQAGDWLVFSGGQYGHIGMALGGVYNGYVALLGENQGGKSCDGGGAATNIINMSVKNLIGYYRPKAYIKVEPAPEPTPKPTPGQDTKVLTYTVKKGDTLGAIARQFCRYAGKKLFGDTGYAQKMAEISGVKNRNLIYPAQKIYCPVGL